MIQVKKGQAIKASYFNHLQEQITALQRALGNQVSTPGQAATLVSVRNDGEEMASAFSVLAIIGQAMKATPRTREIVLKARPAVAGDDLTRFVIVQDAILPGKVGKAAIAGATWCRILGSETNYAQLEAGNYYLTFAPSGPAQVIFFEAPFALVRFPIGGSGGVADIWRLTWFEGDLGE